MLYHLKCLEIYFQFEHMKHFPNATNGDDG